MVAWSFSRVMSRALSASKSLPVRMHGDSSRAALQEQQGSQVGGKNTIHASAGIVSSPTSTLAPRFTVPCRQPPKYLCLQQSVPPWCFAVAVCSFGLLSASSFIVRWWATESFVKTYVHGGICIRYWFVWITVFCKGFFPSGNCALLMSSFMLYF